MKLTTQFYLRKFAVNGHVIMSMAQLAPQVAMVLPECRPFYLLMLLIADTDCQGKLAQCSQATYYIVFLFNVADT